jgi:hypothetical protein
VTGTPPLKRKLFNRMVGILHHCLPPGRHYDEYSAVHSPGRPETDVLDSRCLTR